MNARGSVAHGSLCGSERAVHAGPAPTSRSAESCHYADAMSYQHCHMTSGKESCIAPYHQTLKKNKNYTQCNSSCNTVSSLLQIHIL